MITEDYVSFETAKLLKEKGFEGYSIITTYDEDAASAYIKGLQEKHLPYSLDDPKLKGFYYTTPTLQMAMKWLREVHNLCLFVIPATIDETFRTGYALYPQCDSKWEWCASKNDRSKATFGVDINKKYCDSYEQACETAIKYCLENLI